MPPVKDVIVLLPGIMGSALTKNGKPVWGMGARPLGSMLFSRGGSTSEALMLKDDDPEAEVLDDGIEATELIPDLHLIPKVWKIDGYSKIKKEIKILFDAKEGENLFPFPYDWRRFNQAAAHRLKKESKIWLDGWRQRGNTEAKLILVAHSMGGLVSRYFLEVLGGWKDTRALITFGTPYRGSLNAVDSLANGVRKGPMGMIRLSDLSRSLNGLYQLLPTFECYDDGSKLPDGSPDLKRVGDIDGIPNIDSRRARAALDFHTEMLDAAKANEQDPEYVKNRYVLRPIVGIRQKTNLSAKRDGNGVEMLQSRRGEDPRGDGTVPRPSATPPERSNEHLELFSATKHASLQNSDSVLVDLEGIVTNFQFDQDHWLGGEGIAELALEVEDVYFDSEPVEIRVEPSIERALDLTAVIRDSATDTEVRRVSLTADGDGGFRVELAPLPAGAYSVTVDGQGAVASADAFAVGETVTTMS